MSDNNCYYNIQGKCTHPKPYSEWVGVSGRDWDSKESCVFTQDGAQGICKWYRFRGI